MMCDDGAATLQANAHHLSKSCPQGLGCCNCCCCCSWQQLGLWLQVQEAACKEAKSQLEQLQRKAAADVAGLQHKQQQALDLESELQLAKDKLSRKTREVTQLQDEVQELSHCREAARAAHAQLQVCIMHIYSWICDIPMLCMYLYTA